MNVEPATSIIIVNPFTGSIVGEYKVVVDVSLQRIKTLGVTVLKCCQKSLPIPRIDGSVIACISLSNGNKQANMLDVR